ncbi:MAG: hypothetical protein QOE31_370 [Solirubrobacteraceae bacterium]|jgi:hypothetical protein|nr:hypothetical protein [Solirubrobacteraceae bacterium]
MPDTQIVLMKVSGGHGILSQLSKQIGEDCARNGGRLVSLHWTTGAFDAVAMIELDSEFLPVFSLETSGLASEVLILRAFGDQETQDTEARWRFPPETGHAGP